MTRKLIPAAAVAALVAACGGPETTQEDERTALTYCPLSADGSTQLIGCGGDPIDPPPRCTSYTYSAWGPCSGTGFQYRTVLSKSPAGCTGTPVTKQACRSFDVGVIPGSPYCAGSELLTIGMDNEDSNAASATGGWIGAITGSGNTTFRFCRVDGLLFKPLTAAPLQALEYAVLKLGTDCPNGSVEFSRSFDNEDDNNANYYSGNIAPNVSDRNTTLRFCLFRYGPDTMTDPFGNPAFPLLGYSYGVLAPADFTAALAHGWIFTDDEDSNNANSYVVPPEIQESALRMVTLFDRNTRLDLAHVVYQ